MSLRTTNSKTGFTLVEVMVAMAVSMGVILLMLQTMAMGAKGYEASTRKIDALVEARAAISVIADDVQTMLGTANNQFGHEAGDGRFHEIWFATLKPESAQDPAKAVGDVCLVQYFTAITPDNPLPKAPVSRKLYRRLWSSGDLSQFLRSGELPSMTPDPGQAETIAFNVTRFVVQPMMSGGAASPLVKWAKGNGSPLALEIDFQVLDDDTAKALQSEEDWNLNSTRASQLVLEDKATGESPNGRDFRVKLKIGHASSL